MRLDRHAAVCRRRRGFGLKLALDRFARDLQQRLAAVGLAKGHGRVADHAGTVARRIAGVARIEQLRREAAAERDLQQSVDRRRTARLRAVQPGRAAQDRFERCRIGPPGFRIRQIVRQVRTHDDECLLAAPDPIQRLRHLVDGRVADEQGHQRELVEHALQERQLHFERVLLGMRECAAVDVRQSLECRQCGRVERHLAQRRREPVSAGCRQASHGDAMGRTDQYDAGNVIRMRCEASVGASLRSDPSTGTPRAARSGPWARVRGDAALRRAVDRPRRAMSAHRPDRTFLPRPRAAQRAMSDGSWRPPWLPHFSIEDAAGRQ